MRLVGLGCHVTLLFSPVTNNEVGCPPTLGQEVPTSSDEARTYTKITHHNNQLAIEGDDCCQLTGASGSMVWDYLLFGPQAQFLRGAKLFWLQ